MKVLVTGGAGYVGSHVAVDLLEKNFEVIILDNFVNSSRFVLDNIKVITGKNVIAYNVDLLDKGALNEVFEKNKIDVVIHCAGHKSVGESVNYPLKYYDNNLISTINLCNVMNDHHVHKLIFSSSAVVYGIPESLPLTENSPLNALNPYGKTKYMLEKILIDLSLSNPLWKIVLLRYFNPVGAHPSGLIGENPTGIPDNLLPIIAKVADEEMDELLVFGGDYDTPDGTGIRDYIHVSDLAKGHVHALESIDAFQKFKIFNLGTGRGYSVLEVINNFEAVSGKTIPYRIVSRRPGDMAVSYADATKAARELNWVATKDIYDMCHDAWNWKQNSKGIDKVF